MDTFPKKKKKSNIKRTDMILSHIFRSVCSKHYSMDTLWLWKITNESSLLFCLLKDGDVREWSTTFSDSKSCISWTSPERIWFHLISWSIFFIFSGPSNWETRATFHAATGATFHGATRNWLQFPPCTDELWERVKFHSH